MAAWREHWMNRFYRSKPGWADGTTEFHRLCARFSPPNARILEIGAGPSNPTSEFLASLGELHGVDISDEVRQNRFLAASHVIANDRYPCDSGMFDLAVSNYVVEHVSDPQSHLLEVRRVLKPGGVYIFRTTNVLHYVGFVSMLTPHWFHLLVANRLRALAADAHDPWKTEYRMNTARSVRAHATQAGMAVRDMLLVEKEPHYGLVARPLFAAMMCYERAVNAFESLAHFRSNIFAVLATAD
jgi:SAM-dependent methyltransferase